MWAARLAALVSLVLAVPAPRYDLVIANALVVDGTGRAPVRGDVAVRGASIAAIGGPGRLAGAAIIDAAGLAVAPGFIALGPETTARSGAESGRLLRAGITTLVGGAAGSSALDVGDALARAKDAGLAVNYATFVAHDTIRGAVTRAGDAYPTPSQLARIKSLLWKAMADGALGLSTRLDADGRSARLSEMIELARVTTNAGGVCLLPFDLDDATLDRAVLTAVRIADVGGARLMLSGILRGGSRRADALDAALRDIASARGRSTDIWLQQPPLPAGWTMPGGLARVAAERDVALAPSVERGEGSEMPAGVLGPYVRERRLLSLEEAVRRMTALPAGIMRLPGRGAVRVGLAADLVVFDPRRVGDAAAADRAAMIDVIVNGIVAVRQGVVTGRLAGQPIAKSLLQPPGKEAPAADEFSRRR
jgi:N-acyl-D-aspartate/D-glutamate deacylase